MPTDIVLEEDHIAFTGGELRAVDHGVLASAFRGAEIHLNQKGSGPLGLDTGIGGDNVSFRLNASGESWLVARHLDRSLTVAADAGEVQVRPGALAVRQRKTVKEKKVTGEPDATSVEPGVLKVSATRKALTGSLKARTITVRPGALDFPVFPGESPSDEIDLVAELRRLKAEVIQLKNKVG